MRTEGRSTADARTVGAVHSRGTPDMLELPVQQSSKLLREMTLFEGHCDQQRPEGLLPRLHMSSQPKAVLCQLGVFLHLPNFYNINISMLTVLRF